MYNAVPVLNYTFTQHVQCE